MTTELLKLIEIYQRKDQITQQLFNLTIAKSVDEQAEIGQRQDLFVKLQREFTQILVQENAFLRQLLFTNRIENVSTSNGNAVQY